MSVVGMSVCRFRLWMRSICSPVVLSPAAQRVSLHLAGVWIRLGVLPLVGPAVRRWTVRLVGVEEAEQRELEVREVLAGALVPGGDVRVAVLGEQLCDAVGQAEPEPAPCISRRCG